MNKIIAIIIMIFIYCMSIMLIFLPKEQFSELENRSLARFPNLSINKIIDGEYMEKIDDYISDNFPFRVLFVNLKTLFSKSLGLQKINDVYIGKKGYLFEDYADIEYKDELANTINELYYKNNNKIFNVMLVPTKIGVYKNELPANVNINDQIKTINNIYGKIDDNVNKIDLFNVFNEKKNIHSLYYKTDHHWTTYGAYFAYQEFAKSNNFDYIELSEFDINEVTNQFKGSTYSKVLDYKTKPESIHIFQYNNNIDVDYVMSNVHTNSLYNFDYLNKKDKYALFLDNNHPLITIVNNNVSSGSLLVIKDSYANCMIPFLVNHFNKIHIIDPRYYKKNITNYIEENNIENILILYNIGTLVMDNNILSIR